MDIGLLLIATGKYDVFVQPLIDSVEKHFFKNDTVIVTIFTDVARDYNHSSRLVIKQILYPHTAFPYATLYRYKKFTECAIFIDTKTKYLFYCDVDMLFVGDVGYEILPDHILHGGLVAVQHPGFVAGGWGSPNVNVESTAYVAEEWRGQYLAGGFQGGTREDYLKMASELDKNIDIDEANGIMAEWHDESHFNAYFYGQENRVPPLILPHQYCMADTNIVGEPKLLALSKDHAALRS